MRQNRRRLIQRSKFARVNATSRHPRLKLHISLNCKTRKKENQFPILSGWLLLCVVRCTPIYAARYQIDWMVFINLLAAWVPVKPGIFASVNAICPIVWLNNCHTYPKCWCPIDSLFPSIWRQYGHQPNWWIVYAMPIFRLALTRFAMW